MSNDNTPTVAAVPAEPVALTWYDGAPPFPQDQEWFIAETTYGDRVVLRSLDEGREHKGNYAFKTADDTYLKAELVKRWMQFPDCEYLPPESAAPQATPPAPAEQERESTADALLIVESYGPWGPDLNDAHRRQIVLADEVMRLQHELARLRHE